MRYILLTIYILSFVSNFAQKLPYEELLFWNKEMIISNHVKCIKSYNINYDEDTTGNDSIFIQSHLHTEELFDSVGRITSKTNHYPFADIGFKKRVVAYDHKDRIDSFYLYSANGFERIETYDWQNDTVTNWMVEDFTIAQRPIKFRRIIEKDENGKITQIIKQDWKVKFRYRFETYETDSFSALVRIDLTSGQIADSTVIHHRLNGDTTYKKEIFQNNLLSYKELHWQKKSTTTKRIEEYTNGEFVKVYYRRERNGSVIIEKQIHTLPSFNFTKLYYYSQSTGLPVKKEVYYNESVPANIVYYQIEKY